jgi:hypothetical protein
VHVSFNSSIPADQWRCRLYAMVANPMRAGLMIGIALLLGFIVNNMYGQPTLASIAEAEMFTVAAVALITIFALWAQVQEHTATSSRLSSVTLMPYGIIYVIPDKKRQIAWTTVKDVKFKDGDVYFWVGLDSVFVPRGAFGHEGEARRFRDAAIAARRGDYSMLPNAYSAQPSYAQHPGQVQNAIPQQHSVNQSTNPPQPGTHLPETPYGGDGRIPPSPGPPPPRATRNVYNPNPAPRGPNDPPSST